MEELNSIVVWAFFGAVVGLVITKLLGLEITSKGVAVTILSIVLSMSIRINYIAYEKFLAFESVISLIKNGNSCQRNMDGHGVPIFKNIAEYFYDRADDKCEQLGTVTVKLTPEEVKKVWSIMIEKAEHTFYATNTIAPKDWPVDSCEKQRNSSVRKIFRVMIRRKKATEFNKALDNLAVRQLKECGVDIVAHYLKDDLYRKYRGEVQELGDIDIVLVDNSVLLLTNYDEAEKVILNGRVTIDAKLVNTARRMFASLEKRASRYAPTSN